MKINRRTAECFERWCEKFPSVETISAEDFSDDKALGDQITRGPKDPATVLSIEGLPLRLQDLLSGKKQEFGLVEILGDGRSISLKQAKIWRLTVRSVGELCFQDCEIGEIAVHQTASYHVKDSKIGKFVVVKDTDTLGYHVQNLKWGGGYLGQFDLHQEKTSAFVGGVSFDGIMLPPTDVHHGVQWLRDTREALNARSNFVAAGIFHASELKLTRPKGPAKFFSAYWWASWGYELGSAFGNSIGRSIWCLVVILAALVVLAYGAGTEVTRPDDLRGWQQHLKGNDCSAQLLRASTYAVRSINPLNFFASQPLVVVSDTFWAVVGGVFSIMGVATVALFLLSLRRRFKLE